MTSVYREVKMLMVVVRGEALARFVLINHELRGYITHVLG